MKRFSQTLKIALALFVGIFSNGLLPSTVAYAATANPPANNGTLKVHEIGTPSGTESNDPKVCSFNFEGFSFDSGQQGYIMINDQPAGPGSYGPYNVGPASTSGYFISQDFNTPSGTSIPNGMYKATMYGKDGPAADSNEKAKSKVFKVECAVAPTPIPIPATPTATAPTCHADGSFALPADTLTIDWSITPAYDGPGNYTVTATALGSNVFVGNKTSVDFEIVVAPQLPEDSDGCSNPNENKPATPDTVTFDDTCGTKNDTYTIPDTEGVAYFVNNAETATAPGKYPATGEVSIVAKAKASYFLTAPYSISKEFTNKPCNVFVCKYVGKPGIDERLQTGQNPISVSINAIKDFTDIGSYFNDAQGRSYVLAYDEDQSEDTLPKCPTEAQEPTAVVTPTTCSLKDEKSGTATATITNTADDTKNAVIYGWQVKQGSSVIASGTTASVSDGTSVTVSLTGLAPGAYTFVITGNDETTASTTFDIATCPPTVTPEKPTAVDSCYGDKDTISIEKTKGVIYKINGVETSGLVAYEGKALVVTAEAAPGYVLKDGADATWTFNASVFTNKQCLTITKTGKVANDTNHDGVIGVGDTVTWEITVTNTGESKLEKFYVTLEDTNVTLQNNGYIGYLGAGEHVTLTGTSVLTAKDFQACKATNTATFFGWRANRSQDPESDSQSWVKSESKPLATASASAEYTLTCPTPGGNILGEGVKTTATPVVTAVAAATTTTPEILPATGPSETSNFFAMIFTMGIAYGATYFLQRRREVTAQ